MATSLTCVCGLPKENAVDAKAREYYRQWAEQYYIDNETDLRRAVVSVLRRNDSRVDELMSDVVWWRLPDWLRTWDPNKGASLIGHVKRSAKWWVYKKLLYEDRRRLVEISFDSPDYDHQQIACLDDPALDICELIEIVRDALTPLQFLTLQRRYVENLSITEMADMSYVSRGLIYSRIAAALEAAKLSLEGKC